MTRTLRRPKVTATALSVAVLTLFLVSLSPLPQLLAATSTSSNGGSAPALNPVQISIQTRNVTAVSSYDLLAYNSTGTLVASYTGQYPRVTLELPSGTYLFAANANWPSPTQSPICYGSSQSKQGTGSGVASPPAQPANSSSVAGSAIAYPCYFANPPSEYGYSLTTVSGSTTLTIATQLPSSIPTTSVSVSVSYKNGTAVTNAYVSASVVGADSYWGDNPGLTLYAQTTANGVAKLVVPAVPLTVTASESVQVNLPKSQTTMQVNIGGQLVNVTLYYSPNYVYESATALLVPPHTSLSMVVTAQTQNLLIPYAVGTAAPGQAVTNAGTAPAPANSPQAQQVPQGAAAVATSNDGSSTTAHMTSIPPIPASDIGAQPSAQPSSNISGFSLLAIGTVAVAAAIAAIVGLAISRTKR